MRVPGGGGVSSERSDAERDLLALDLVSFLIASFLRFSSSRLATTASASDHEGGGVMTPDALGHCSAFSSTWENTCSPARRSSGDSSSDNITHARLDTHPHHSLSQLPGSAD